LTNIETFLGKIRGAVKGIDKTNNQTAKPIKLGIHFNISAYAPFDVISRFFYNFVLFGFLWDEATGDMEFIPDNIFWYVSNLLNILDFLISTILTIVRSNFIIN
jgi:hypothetical protein